MVTFAGAYVLVMLAVIFYVGWMSSRQRRLSEQLADLQRRLAEAEGADREAHPSLREAA